MRHLSAAGSASKEQRVVVQHIRGGQAIGMVFAERRFKGWYHISFGEDSTGWVRAEFVR